ncbi:Peroxidase [Quillaja saponaria]|uniref:Peroxidase n=1 Tax=Quillaja saponaria TaxID=32244 RepID=A0AAD7LF94_QUISA|nr:Peroxidase [Quillaja saponaria]
MALQILFLLFLTIPFSEASLSPDYYKKTCPDFDKIVRETVFPKQQEIPTTAPGLLRLFFHDCMIDGCDASVFIASNTFTKSERDTDENLSLSGDAFDIVVKIKTALELACPGIVSCADIIAQATRDLVKQVGGPYYPVRLGRKDSLVSNSVRVHGHIPTPNMTMNQIIDLFTSKGFTIQEMVALTGAHTIGFSHCKEFSNRIFNYSSTSQADPAMHPTLADGLRRLCANYTTDPAMSAFNDVMSPGQFDNNYYRNILKGLGLLASDHLLGVDPRTRPFVELYARDQNAFYKDFAHAMEKLGRFGIKTGHKGEVRRRCDTFNTINP